MKIPLNKSTLSEEEYKAVIDVLDSGFLTMGSKCFEFEAEFAKYVGSKNAVFVNSGSSANLLAFFAIANPLCPIKGKKRKLMPGDEVIVPAVTWSTSVWPIIQAGAIPRFVDCDPTTLQVTPETVKAAINEKTVGICAVHILGNGLDGSAYAQIANEHGLWLIEDTCESLGVKSDNKHVGTFGDIGTYSFYFSHHITSVEGGMVVTDDDDMANLLRSLRSHGWTRHRTDTDKFTQLYPEVDPRFMFITTGFNVRPTDINAAIGLKQLPKLEGFNAHRRDISAAISAGLKPLADEGILSLIRYDAKISAAPFGYPVICSSRAIRDKLQKHLENSGIETRPIICGNMTRQPAFQHYDYLVSGDLRGADAVMDCGLYWGTHPGMTQSEVDYIVNSVRECFAK